MSDSVRREMVLPHPPEAVWRALTEREAMAEWLFPSDFEPRVGHRFTLRSPSNPEQGFDGQIRCEVLECEPPSRLVYSWVAYGVDTRVSFRLEPVGDGTRLRFEQSGPQGLGPGGLVHNETLATKVGVPLELSVWVADRWDPNVREIVPVDVRWFEHQGPPGGDVRFDERDRHALLRHVRAAARRSGGRARCVSRRRTRLRVDQPDPHGQRHARKSRIARVGRRARRQHGAVRRRNRIDRVACVQGDSARGAGARAVPLSASGDDVSG